MRTDHPLLRVSSIGVLLGALAASVAVSAADWPEWRGPARDGKSSEQGLLEAWPEGGPAVVWEAKGAGTGYSSLAIHEGRVLTMGNRGDEEFVIAFSAKDGEELWRRATGPAFTNDRGSGPRGTPTIEGDTVWALGSNGRLVCLKVADGEPVWSLDILETFGGENTRWGLAESVLIDGDRLICTPGGPDATVVALDKRTGKTLWTSKGLGDRAGYASPIAATIEGKRQYIVFTHQSAAGVSASGGELLWRYTKANNGIANCTTPLLVGPRHVFLTSAYGQGCALLELSGAGAEEVFFHKDMKNHHGGVILLDGHLYGHSGGNSERIHTFVCLDALSGEVKWQDKGIGKSSVIWADDRLYCLTEDGRMGLAKVSPAGYELVSEFVFKKYESFKMRGIGEDDEKPTWAHPAIANRRLYLRDQDRIVCYDIAR